MEWFKEKDFRAVLSIKAVAAARQHRIIISSLLLLSSHHSSPSTSGEKFFALIKASFLPLAYLHKTKSKLRLLWGSTQLSTQTLKYAHIFFFEIPSTANIMNGYRVPKCKTL